MQHSQDRSGEHVGDYRLLRRLGRGSFGEVYQAEDRRSHRSVAVKLLNALLTNREDLKAFLNEARSIRLHHPHIVPLLDFGLSEHDLPFLVMEYMAGGTLRDRYPKSTRVPLDVVVDLTTQLASALQYAHDQHLVHRDVKPENMLSRADGTVLLSDFGIASVVHASSSLSVYEGVGGTLPYMAPEQIEGKPRRESDQYALAVVVYEWLAGARPFQGTPPELISQHLRTPPPRLLDQVPTLPAAVEQVVLKALSKQPQERFARVDDFAAALQAASQIADAPSSTMTPSPSSLSSLKPMSEPLPLSPSSPTVTATPGWSPSIPIRSVNATPEPDATSSFPTSPPASFASLPGEKEAVRPPTRNAEFPSAPPSPLTDLPPQGPALRSPQVTISSQRSPTFSPPLTPARRRSPTVVVVRILLLLLLLGGGSFGIYGATTGNWPWNPWHSQNSGTSRYLRSVTWSGSQFVAVGYIGTILTSPDGSTWTARNFDSSVSLYAVAWSGSQFVAVGENGTILTSPDGSTWTAQNFDSPYYLFGVTWSGLQFVAVGVNGTILTSPDGLIWNAQNSGTVVELNSVVWSGSQFIAVGENGTILTSPDGATWTARNPVGSGHLYAVTWSGSQFVAVGENGTILISPDGHTWTAQNSGSSVGLNGVAWSGSRFVVVGFNGTILTSPNGSTWMAQEDFGRSIELDSVAWSGSQFVAVGGNGTVLTSP